MEFIYPFSFYIKIPFQQWFKIINKEGWLFTVADRKQRKRGNKNENLSEKYAKKLLSFLDKTTDETDQIDMMNSVFRNVVNDHLTNLKSESSGAIIDFIKSQEKSPKDDSQLTDNFMKTVTDNATGLYGSMSQSTRSMYSKYLDIEYVIKFVPSVKQALNMAVNNICCSDEASETIVYKTIFDSSFSDSEQKQITDIIDQIENEYDIQRKLKNNTIKPSVEIGTSYCYIKPYKEIFFEYAQLKANQDRKENRVRSKNNDQDGKGKAMESFMDHTMAELYPISKAYEGITLMKDAMEDRPLSDKEVNKILEGEQLSDFLLNTSYIPEEAIQDAMALESVGKLGKTSMSTGTGSPRTRKVLSNNMYMDNVVPTKDMTDNPFDKYTGVYIKMMDFKNMVPLTAFGEKICYLYIHSDKKKFKQEFSSQNGINMLNSVGGYGANSKEKLFDNMVSGLCNQITKDFGIDFLDKNIQFKKQIAECLITHGFTNNKYKIQVIPASDIIEFKIKEDADGNGHSLVEDSIVPGKMLSSLTVSKLLNYLNKYGDRTLVNYTKNPMDHSGNNLLQQLIRNFQESDINLPDILSGELLFNKIGRNNRLAIPKDENGTRVIEFEQLEGQRVDLNTDYEEYLTKLTNMGTETPSSIMDYIDQVDFAKQVTTSNIKYAITISGLQADLEPSITEYYRRILVHSGLPEELKNKINGPGFKISLARPKVLSNSNILEAYGSAQQMGEQLGNVILASKGIDDNNPKAAEMRAIFQLEYIKENVPFVDIDKYVDLADKIILEAETKPKEEAEAGSM